MRDTTLLNAVPQLQWQNNGLWKDLEEQCERWADERGAIWVTCGPVFFGKSPSIWFGQNDEVRAAVPDALFKIVAWVDNGKVKASAYLMPHMIPDKNAKFTDLATTVDEIEAVTGLDFFTTLEHAGRESLRAVFQTLYADTISPSHNWSKTPRLEKTQMFW